MRPLTDTEKAAIPAQISSLIDLEKIEIHDRRWTPLTPRTITVARGYKIFWPGAPVSPTKIFELAHIVHEVAHVWQYKHLGVSMYSPRWLDRRYDYRLNAGDRFLSFGLEQQASIIEDHYLLSQNFPPRRAQNNPRAALYDEILDQLTSPDFLV